MERGAGVPAHARSPFNTSRVHGRGSERADVRTGEKGDTGHAESVEIIYDADIVSFGRFWTFSSTSTTRRRSTSRAGTRQQHRSAIFFADQGEWSKAEGAASRAEPIVNKTVVTSLEPLKNFGRQTTTSLVVRGVDDTKGRLAHSLLASRDAQMLDEMDSVAIDELGARAAGRRIRPKGGSYRRGGP